MENDHQTEKLKILIYNRVGYTVTGRTADQEGMSLKAMMINSLNFYNK